ncbi:MAG: DAK2 domain-containing protein [Peptostreptococcaceae bacterium]
MKTINGKNLKEMFISGANNLQNHKDLVDKLNVFPVPDGDTGTNMSLTISYAIKELEKVQDISITSVGKSLSKGSLMGARGNSGVILSQIIRGIAKSIEEKEELDTKDFADALKNGADTAYKAVIKPIEGTILTVIRESADYAVKISKKETDIMEFLELVIKEANESLKRTPDLLKSLKDAGVVDSGGKGLVLMYDGFLSALRGNIISLSQNSTSTETVEVITQANYNVGDIEFGYCTEFILESDKIDEIQMRDLMMPLGDSLAVVGDEGVIKIHIHTENPGKALDLALQYGQLLTIKIENMRVQHENILQMNEEVATFSEEEKEYGFIATSMGKGLNDIFKDFGVDHIIEGGQTMNPSTEDFIKAIDSVNAKNIFIFPNNSNIIMAANQAKEISDKNIVVIPTKTTPQALTALIGFNSEASVLENEETFNEALTMVKSGQVTFAVRDTVMNDIEVKKDNIIGISQSDLVSVGEDAEEVTFEMVSKLVDEESAIITLFYGEDTKEEDAEKLKEQLEEKYDELDVELYYGGQPLYYYLVSVE